MTMLTAREPAATTASPPLPAPPAPRLSAADLAAATPDTRDRTVDLLRVASLVVVVLGHWLVAAVELSDGRLDGGNLLSIQPATQPLTWLFQVMPVFFAVGGYANAASWTSARRTGTGYGDWLRFRAVRLLRPTAALAAVWVVVGLVGRGLGADPATLSLAGRLVGYPLWFLAVYLLVVALAPAMFALHRRFAWRVPVALALGAAVVDAAHWELGLPVVGTLNYALVWLAVHQLGLLWRDGQLRRPGLLLGGGLVALVLLVTLADYPISLVGSGGAGRDNNEPASLALVALGVAQVGAALLARPRLERRLAAPRVWAAVIAANGVAMTLFLWHFTAFSIATAVLVPSGLFPAPAIGSTTWWLLRPLWLALLAVVLVPLVALFARVEQRPVSRVRGASPLGVALAAALGAAAMVLLTIHGLVVSSLPLGLPLPALALLGAAAVLLRAPDPSRRRPVAGSGRGPDDATRHLG